MSAIRKGDRGEIVKNLQELLQQKGYIINPDGFFGAKTEGILKKFQSENNLYSDGIAGRKTLKALDGVFKASPYRMASAKGSERINTGGMNISSRGRSFIFKREAQAGVSCHLHWPKGASGVTLGPGYDMKERSEVSIKNTMIKIGVSNNIAEKISKASHLAHSDAERFVALNINLVKLTGAQETNLLEYILPPYVNLIKNRITVPLTQNEFDALVSFAYNPGGRLPKVCSFINKGMISDAMDEIKKAITSRHKVMSGLVHRRNFEVDLFLNGIYA